MDDLILLISESYIKDEIGQLIPDETSTQAWAHLQSVTRSEWANAGQKGMQPQLVAITPIVNYHGESIVQIGAGESQQRYSIYRTYFGPNSDTIELYLERKAGTCADGEKHSATRA